MDTTLTAPARQRQRSEVGASGHKRGESVYSDVNPAILSKRELWPARRPGAGNACRIALVERVLISAGSPIEFIIRIYRTTYVLHLSKAFVMEWVSWKTVRAQSQYRSA